MHGDGSSIQIHTRELLFCLCKALGKTPLFPLEIGPGVSKAPLRSRSRSVRGFSNLTQHLSFLPSHALVLGKSANALKFSGYAADSISHIASTRRRPSASRKRIFALGATQQSSSRPHSISVATALKEGEGKKVKDVLGGLVPYGPAVTEHVTLTVGLTGSTPFTAELNTPALVCAARHAPRSLPSLSLSRAQGAPRLEREAVDPIVYSCRHRKAGAGGRSGRHHTHLRRRFREGVLNGERGGGRWRRCTRRWGTCTRGC